MLQNARQKKVKLCAIIALVAVLALPALARAAPPVVVEFFGKNSCTLDEDIQKNLRNIVREHENVIVINCRTWYAQSTEVKSFAHSFCTDRQRTYAQSKSSFGFSGFFSAMVNGRWEANVNDIMPAVKLGRTDVLQEITLQQKGKQLHITIPGGIEGGIEGAQSGEILLYSYVPTLDERTAVIGAQAEISDQLQQQINQNQSVPFVAEKREIPFYFRPVIAMDKIGTWHGAPMNIVVPIDEIKALSSESRAQMSYIVTLHAGGEVGKILASGELIAFDERRNTLPHSKPIPIHLQTQPPAAKPPIFGSP